MFDITHEQPRGNLMYRQETGHSIIAIIAKIAGV